MSQPVIQIQGICKTYPGCIANDGIDLTVNEGEIHALLGENGAGKSTLMKIIYGVISPDSGDIIWRGRKRRLKGPAHARALGIGMVFQHFSLFETLSVADNIALSLPKEQTKHRAEFKQRIRDTSQRYGIEVDPDRLVHSLSVGEQQRVEIVRCLLQDVRLLILDEPTSVLTPQEVTQLFATLHRLADEGCAILFISHKLDEVTQLCHHATLLRHGKVSGECDPQITSPRDIARLLVGDDTPLTDVYPKHLSANVSLVVNNLSYHRQHAFESPLKHISFTAYKGEILGIAGISGNGQDELFKLLSGEQQSRDDSIQLHGQHIGHLGVEQRRQHGVGFVPTERLVRGGVANLSLVDNALLTLGSSNTQEDLVQRGWINDERAIALTERIIERYNVKCAGPHAQAKSLSGGNLQKFIIGREIEQAPKLLLCSQPTWGVDVGAAVLIRNALVSLCEQGSTVIVVSEDLNELFQISDRLCAICHGQLSPILPTSNMSVPQLGQWMAGDFKQTSNASI